MAEPGVAAANSTQNGSYLEAPLPLSAYVAFECLSKPLALRKPVKTIAAYSLDQVRSAVAAAEDLARAGLHVFGMLAYEAAPAFDSKMAVHRDPLSEDYPLVLFRAFKTEDSEEVCSLPVPRRSDHNSSLPTTMQPSSLEFAGGPLQPSVDYPTYSKAIDSVREEIRKGNTYQTNHTMRLRGSFHGNHLALLDRLLTAQSCGYGAYLDLGRYKILSASPERFFSWDVTNGIIEARPMKGTAPRGLDAASDAANKEYLKTSPKERAENLMIVDLLRNDLSRCAVSGTVTVPSLFRVEKFPTVWQMTSTVSCRSKPNLPLNDILTALFPCGSITGAPKISTMKIIRDLECSPRGVYCGSLVYLSPGLSRIEASVPIRTAVIDSLTCELEYGVGGGITWDSRPQSEWDECGAKSRVLRRALDPFADLKPSNQEFELLETMRMESDGSVVLLEGHLERALASADCFDIPLTRDAILSALSNLNPKQDGLRVRLTVSKQGCIGITTAALPAPFRTKQKVTLASQSIDQRDVYYYHKTTRRGMYEQLKKTTDPSSSYFDVLLHNSNGEVTEFSIGNLVIELPLDSAPTDLTTEEEHDDRDSAVELDTSSPFDPSSFPNPRAGYGLFTPPVSSGLLPGVFRNMLLKGGFVTERKVGKEEIEGARCWMVNAVRGFVEVEVQGLGQGVDEKL